jgi:hypothetical protein
MTEQGLHLVVYQHHLVVVLCCEAVRTADADSALVMVLQSLSLTLNAQPTGQLKSSLLIVPAFMSEVFKLYWPLC